MAARFVVVALLALCLPAARAQTVEAILDNGLFEPYGVAIGVGNLYYVTDSANNRVIVVNPLTGTFTNLAGTAKGAVDGSPEQARFYSPQGIVRTSSGLFIADSGNNLIRKIDLNGNVSTIVGDAISADLSHQLQLPVDNSGTNDGPGLQARLNAPSGLAIDPTGTSLLLADTLNGTIRRVSLTANYPVTTVLVNDRGAMVPARFNRPTAVAISATGRIFVADSERHGIYEVMEGDRVALIAGSGNPQASGAIDNSTAIRALLNSPRGLYVDDVRHEILVSDSGNGLLRRITNLDQGPMGVQTIAGSRDAGILKPMGIARDIESVIVFADLDANAIKGLRQTTAQPQIGTPQIGVVFTNNCALFAVTNATFVNEQFLAIVGEDGTATYYTYGPTENAALIPDPSPEASAAPEFEECESPNRVNLINRISPRWPRLTIKAMSSANGRRPSVVTVANITFQAANPSILGADATSLSFVTQTENAKIYYTYGSNPADPNPDDPSTNTRLYNGASLNLYDERTNVTVKVIATRPNYLKSSVVSRTYLREQVQRSIVGIPRNFVAGVGSTIAVPITLNVAQSNVVRTLQFRVEASPKDGARTNAIPTLNLLPVRAEDFININFPGANLASSAAYSLTDAAKTVIAKGLSIFFLQTNANFVVSNQVTLGVLSVQIPRNAVEGDVYNLSIVKPSGTSDGVDTPVTLGAGPVVSVTITNKPYVVGDVAPAVWYNTGDFGTLDAEVSPTIENNDVTLAFRASLGMAVPYQFSDIFDAMDVFPLDTEGVAGGDGVIRYLDWQVILRRSLGLDQAMWERRRDANGDIIARALNGSPLLPADILLARSPKAAAALAADESPIVWNREVLLVAGSLQGDEAIQGNTVSVPISMRVRPGFSISGMRITATVTPLNGAIAITNVAFERGPGIPNISTSGASVGSYSPAWSVDSFSPALTGSNFIGNVRFTIPLTATTGQRYLIQLTGDGSPDLNTQYDFFETSRAYVSVHSAGPVDDAISDQWREHFFGSVDSALSAAYEDPDGDGAPNIVEFRDGTSPVANNLRVKVTPVTAGESSILIKWFGAFGVKYAVEASATLKADSWTTMTPSITGQGAETQLLYQNLSTPQFYRVRALP
jgi:hypothetical protein